MHKRLVFLFVLFLIPVLAQGQEDVKFKPVVLPDAIRFVTAFSQDSQAATMIFDNFTVSTRADKGELPDTTIKSFTFCLQPEIAKKAVVEYTVRGYSSTQGTASATAIIHAAGKTTVVKLGSEAKKNKTSKKEDGALNEQARKLAKDQGFALDEPPSTSDDYQATFNTDAMPGKPLQITIILLVDRLPGDESGGALLTVDTIDFEISKE
jgi:hypothetical protein